MMNMSQLNVAEAQTIGFNSSVDVGGLTFHLQTEVVNRGGIIIRSTVLDGGVAKGVRNHPVPAHIYEMEGLIALVRAQHQHYFDDLKRTGAAWR
jgi:hypothetical protein